MVGLETSATQVSRFDRLYRLQYSLAPAGSFFHGVQLSLRWAFFGPQTSRRYWSLACFERLLQSLFRSFYASAERAVLQQAQRLNPALSVRNCQSQDLCKHHRCVLLAPGLQTLSDRVWDMKRRIHGSSS